MRAFGIDPNRELGQNFLVDDNVLRVIERLAELEPGDVVLEVGGGLGVLSERLAPRVAHLHVVEVDRSLAAPLADALAPFPNVSVHFADAVRLPFAGLAPVPGKLVANLPYGVAATVLLKVLEELADAKLFLVMVQREVAERLAAAPGSRVYGATSVLAQLSGDVRFERAVSRTVFRPQPHVDSALVSVRRRRPPPSPEVRAVVRAAFAHRRKTLPGSLALAPGAPPGLADRARAGLEQIGLGPGARAERLAPEDFDALAARLAPDDLAALRRAGREGP